MCKVTGPYLRPPTLGGAGLGVTAHSLRRDLGTVTVPEQSSPGPNSCAGQRLPLYPLRGLSHLGWTLGGPTAWACCDGEGR